jgi:nicotinamidase/pyrazinamidase
MSQMRESNTAFLVIDMLNDFILPDGALTCGAAGQAIVPNVKRRLDEARAQGMRVFYICDRHRPDDVEFRIWPPHCVAGTPGAEVVAELAPRQEDIIVPKRRYSGFFGTDLEMNLRELGIGRLMLTGVCTNICVLYTAADAKMRGFGVCVARDCVASFDAAAHEWALKELERTLSAQILL